MFRCTGQTSNGTRCRCRVSQENGTCSWHKPIEGDSTCPICMEVMTQRNVREMPCGHKFHKKCINKWKNEGNRSCPMCREPFDIPEFRVTVTIEPLVNGTIYETTVLDASNSISNVVTNVGLNIDDISHLTTQLSIEADNIEMLRNVLERIGLDLDYANLDSLMRRDTE